MKSSFSFSKNKNSVQRGEPIFQESTGLCNPAEPKSFSGLVQGLGAGAARSQGFELAAQLRFDSKFTISVFFQFIVQDHEFYVRH